MTNPISQQLMQAVLSLALGAAAGFVYDFFRAIRWRVRWKVVTGFLDLVFVAALLLTLFAFGLTVGNGRSRIFMSILAVLGGVIYFASLSRIALKICRFIVEALAFLLKCIAAPFWGLYIILKKMINLLKNIFLYQKKRYTIGVTIRRSDRKPPRNRGREAAQRDAARRKRPRGAGGGERKTPGGGYGVETEAVRYHYEDSGVRAGGVRRGDADQYARKNRGRAAGPGRNPGAGRR